MTKAKGGKRGQAADIEQLAKSLAEPIVTERGFTLWDVVFEKEGAMWYLRILFDKEGGVSDEECEAITAPLNAAMDNEKFIKDVDILEIGSPGITKRLRHPEHFQSSVGRKVRAQTKDQNGKPLTIIGILTDYSLHDEEIFIDNKPLKIKKIIRINLDL